MTCIRERTLDAVSRISPLGYDKLPTTLKVKLLDKLAKRGLCNDVNLSLLLHERISHLDLRECVVSNKGLECLDRVPQLKILHMPQPPLIRDSHFSEQTLIKALSNKLQLRILDLKGLSGATDRVISSVVGGSPSLCELHISMTRISDHGLTTLATLTQLSCLDVAKTEISDVGIQNLVSGGAGRSLQELRLDGCAKLTDDSIEAVCTCCSHINILCFNYCPRISERSRELVSNLTAERLKQLTWTVY
ncbi:protein AMN1 homolog isoform X2 [Oratosquilla oratoria]|uniref:protein AMN1 homolog isoform X2 n=1 Tax=Oratosquilla oratoria TaxID=337810 RepID=UPI003F7582CE